jgi:hypothetical protein
MKNEEWRMKIGVIREFSFIIQHSSFSISTCVLPNAECRHTKAQKSVRDASTPSQRTIRLRRVLAKAATGA